jgi:hypothetical protein
VAIYRPPKARWPLAVAAGLAGLLCGVVLGAVLFSADPDPLEAAGEIKASLVAAAGSLEVAAIEYEEAVPDGEVDREPEYEGALAAFESSRERYGEVRGALDVLVPDLVDGLDASYERCGEMMTAVADAAEVEACLAELEEALKGDA